MASKATLYFRGSANGFLFGAFWGGAGLAGGSDRRRDDGASRSSLPSMQNIFASRLQLAFYLCHDSGAGALASHNSMKGHTTCLT